ncbi:hypothetical protein SISSUDRAFT_1051983 [Sistotremastrum suecicum HHB10207 ss-3]|uniref:Tyrosinase copper-binding domain-containing protein n=1 Tax=Sistotremastrum suecicum HHB10207 ss-3 TaxID=1314776 RepID=A0A166A7D6_9AGAM|nr:hypothetical protein SISSUDRAFT_1051983 [Sistotremastrum suecicum HHB10207 ss-3]
MRLPIPFIVASGYCLILALLADDVSSKAIYDIHAYERQNQSTGLTAQRSKLASNAQVLASGSKRVQPPKPIARKIVEGKKSRGNPIDTAPLARRSAAPNVAPCGFIDGYSEDAMSMLANLDSGPTRTYDHAWAIVLDILPLFRQVWLPPPDVSGFINLNFGNDILDEGDPVLPGPPLGAVWQPFTGDKSVGPFSLGSGSSNFAFLGPVPESTGPAALFGTPNPSEPISLMDPFDPPFAPESDIWSINPVTLEVTATWTNPDGTRLPATIFWDDTVDYGNVGITGDLNAVVSASKAALANSIFGPVSPDAIPIRLFYVDIDPDVCAAITL